MEKMSKPSLIDLLKQIERKIDEKSAQTATLTFILPQDTKDFEDALNGYKYKSTLYELDQWLRRKEKYESLENISISEIRQEIFNLCTESQISLY